MAGVASRTTDEFPSKAREVSGDNGLIKAGFSNCVGSRTEKERAHLITEKNLQGAPDLVIEILSPSTKPRDERLKRDLYERAGVKEYWLVDPERETVRVYRRQDREFLQPVPYTRDDTLDTPLLPGLQLPIAKVLA